MIGRPPLMDICAIGFPDFTFTLKTHDLYSHLLFASGVAAVSNAMPNVSLVANVISFAAADESGPPQTGRHPVDARSNVQTGPPAGLGKPFAGTPFAISTDPPPTRASKAMVAAKRKTRDILLAVAFISTANANKKPQMKTTASRMVATPVPPLFSANRAAQNKPDRIAQPVQRISSVCAHHRFVSTDMEIQISRLIAAAPSTTIPTTISAPIMPSGSSR